MGAKDDKDQRRRGMRTQRVDGEVVADNRGSEKKDTIEEER